VQKRVELYPQTRVERRPATQYGWDRATIRKGSDSKRLEDLLSRVSKSPNYQRALA